MSEGRDKEAVSSGPQAMRLIPQWMELAFTLEKQDRKSLAKKKKKIVLWSQASSQAHPGCSQT